MFRKQKQKITLEQAIKLVPHDEFYCLDSGRCPFWQLRNFSSKGKQYRKAKKDQVVGIPSYYCSEGRHQLEYCSLIKKYLWCQDGVKDCALNCDITKEQQNASDESWVRYINSQPTPEAKEKAQKEFEQNEYKSYKRTFHDFKTVEFYKELFPDETELIDKIVEEEGLTEKFKEQKEKYEKGNKFFDE